MRYGSGRRLGQHLWRLWRPLGIAIALLGILVLSILGSVANGSEIMEIEEAIAHPSQAEVCAIVTAMPGAEDTDRMLALLGSDRFQIIHDLEATSANMQRYDAEGLGWQNVIDGSSALEPRPDSWLLGALRMACEF